MNFIENDSNKSTDKSIKFELCFTCGGWFVIIRLRTKMCAWVSLSRWIYSIRILNKMIDHEYYLALFSIPSASVLFFVLWMKQIIFERECLFGRISMIASIWKTVWLNIRNLRMTEEVGWFSGKKVHSKKLSTEAD